MFCQLFVFIVTLMNIAVFSDNMFFVNDTTNLKPTSDFNDVNSTMKEGILQLNMTELYENYLLQVANYCMTKQEFADLYGNKASWSLVYLFAPYLVDETSKYIGLNILRHYFNLKSQRFNYVDEIVEESEEITKNKVFLENLKYFQYKTNFYSKYSFEAEFSPNEIDVAVKFFDQKLPEIRQLYKLKYYGEAEKIGNKTIFNKDTIDKMFGKFLDTKNDIWNAFINIYTQSYIGFTVKKSPRNRCSN